MRSWDKSYLQYLFIGTHRLLLGVNFLLRNFRSASLLRTSSFSHGFEIGFSAELPYLERTAFVDHILSSLVCIVGSC